MKRYISNILTAVSLLFVTVACNDVILSEHSGKTGRLSVRLGMDDQVLTKSDTLAPDSDMAFLIKVSGDRKDTVVTDHRTLAEPIVVPVGTYSITASCGDSAAIGFDVPYYKGTAMVDVTTDDEVEAEVICKLANVMVTVDFDESITENFTSYSVFVEDGNGKGFSFSSEGEGNLDAIGYLPAGSDLKWQLVLTNEEGGHYVATDKYEAIEAQHCYNIRFALSEGLGDSGFAAIKLVVDTSVNEDRREIELDFSESQLPSFSPNEGFEPSKQMTVIVGDTSKKEITFSAPDGIKTLLIALDNDIPVRSSMVRYDLVEATDELIATLRAMGIKTQSIPFGSTSAKIDFTDYIKNLPTGEYNVDLTLYDAKGHVSNCSMDFSVISDVDAAMVSVSPWAKFAIAKGKYFSATAPEGTTFMYRKKTDSEWKSVATSAIRFNTSNKTFEAEVGGLDASSEYVIKAVSANDTDTNEMSFRTGSAETLYNMNFDEWWQDGKVWYPYANGANPTIWDSANKGAATYIGSSTSPVEGKDAVKGKAVKMESKYAVIAFAAGNLYTGKFGKIDGVGAQLDWGVPFSSRPVALKGYYKYTSKPINRTGSGKESMNGQQDRAQITIALADWNGTFRINTKKGEFVDFNGSDIIAYGRLESDQSYSDYVEFTIPLEYRYTDKTPKYIVISAAASYLGDYFTGGEGSTLYLDELTFEYDITKLTDEQKAKVHCK